MTARCVEFVAVYDDGTVDRWEGHEAMIMAAQLPIAREQPTIGLIVAPTPTTTHPLRKTTVVRGSYWQGDYDDPDGIKDEADGYTVGSTTILPEETSDVVGLTGYGRRYDFRITVEATPVEEKP